MKRLFTTLFILTWIIAPSLAAGQEVVNYDDLVERNDLFYKKFTDEPFTGKTTGKEQGTFRNGKREGRFVKYYDTGELRFKGAFKNGKHDGPLIFYHKNGQLYRKVNSKDGNWIGFEIFYWSNGQLFGKGNRNNEGEKHGPWISYHKNGQLMMKGNFKNGKRDGPWVFYDEDGGIGYGFLPGTYRNGRRVSD